MTFATSGTNEPSPLGNRTGRNPSFRAPARDVVLPLTKRARRGEARERKPYRDWVERLILEGGRTAKQIAEIVGGECTPGYVSSVSYATGNLLFKPEPFKPRTEDDIRNDAALMLGEQWKAQQRKWGF